MKSIESEKKMIQAHAAERKQAGEISLQWDSPENAHYYILEMKRRRSKKWNIVDIFSESKYLVENLKPDCDYCFRVSVLLKNGKSEIVLTANIKTK